MKHPDAPLNLMALNSVWLGGVGVLGLILITGTCGVGVVLAPLGLVVGWAGLGLGLLGWRHARIHGFGLEYARYGVLLNLICVHIHALICLIGVGAMVGSAA